MTKRFSVYETHSGFYLEDLVTKRVACMSDGVGIDFGDDTTSLTCGMHGFEEAWAEDANLCLHTYFEAYFSDLYGLEIYDNPKFADRYTVILEEASPLEKSLQACASLYHCLSLSDNPDSPQGFSQWGTCDANHMAETQGRTYFLDLPENVQRHIVERLKE